MDLKSVRDEDKFYLTNIKKIDCKLALNTHHVVFSSSDRAVFQKMTERRNLWQVHYYLGTNLNHMAVNVKYGF